MIAQIGLMKLRVPRVKNRLRPRAPNIKTEPPATSVMPFCGFKKSATPCNSRSDSWW